MTGRSSRSRVWSWVVLVVVAAAAAYIVQQNEAEIRDTYAEIGWAAMAGAGLLALAGTLTIGMVWRSLLLGMDVARLPVVDGFATFYVTQLGKYVPGAVWPILAQVAAARRWGYRRSSIVTANLLMMFMLSVSGVVLGLLLLPWVADFGRPWLAWGLVAVPVLVWLLVPGSAAALVRRLPLPAAWRLDASLTTGASVRAVVWSVATWLLLGSQLGLLLYAAGGRGFDTVAAAFGGVGLAYAVGLVVVVAPAGAGAREAVLVAVCAPVVGSTAAFAVALACRILLTMADLLLALLGGLRGVARGVESPAAAKEQ